jgi:repressor LexA
MEKLTASESTAYGALKKFIEVNGYPPTIRELAKLLDVRSTSTVHYCLINLELKGYIRRGEGARAIAIIK